MESVFSRTYESLRKDKVDVVLELLADDPNLARHSCVTGWTLLHQAAAQNHGAVASALLEFGADVNSATFEFQDTPLHVAVRNNSVSVVTLLLTAGANPDALDRHLVTPIFEASHRGNALVVRLLLASNAKLKLLHLHGLTPLMLAANGSVNNSTDRHAKTVVELVAAGADLYVRDDRGRNALELMMKDHRRAGTFAELIDL